MTTILSLLILLLVVAGMSIGVLLGRPPIKGSCGGMSALGLKTSCEICGGDAARCEKEQAKRSASSTREDLAYEAETRRD